jgi:hypothetical protein
MQIDNVIERLKTYRRKTKSVSNAFSLSSSHYLKQFVDVKRCSMFVDPDSYYWSIPSELVAGSSRLLSLISEISGGSEGRVDSDDDSEYILQAISFLRVKHVENMPWSCILDLHAAWHSLRNPYERSARKAIDDWFEENTDEHLNLYIKHIESTIDETVAFVKSGSLYDALKCNRVLLVNLDFFMSKFRDEHVAHLLKILGGYRNIWLPVNDHIAESVVSQIEKYTEAMHSRRYQDTELNWIGQLIMSQDLRDQPEGRALLGRQVYDFHRSVLTMRSLDPNPEDGTWMLSRDTSENVFLNNKSASEFFVLADRFKIVATLPDAYKSIFRELGDPVSQELQSKLLMPAYAGNPLNQLTLFHLCFSAVVCGLQRGDSKTFAKYILDMSRQLDRVLEGFSRLRSKVILKQCLELAKKFGAQDAVLVGHLFYLYSELFDSSGYEQNVLSVARRQKQGDTSYQDFVSSISMLSTLNRFFTEFAEHMGKIASTNFAQGYFTDLGYIVPRDFSRYQRTDDIGEVHRLTPVSVLASHTERAQRLLALMGAFDVFGKHGEPIYHFDAIKILEDSPNWDKIKSAMDLEASNMLALKMKHGKLPQSLAVLTSSKKFKCPKVCRRGIARRVFIALAFDSIEEETGRSLGFKIPVAQPKSKSQKEQKRRSTRNFQKYVREWQLNGIDWVNAQDSVAITTDEREFLASSRQ